MSTPVGFDGTMEESGWANLASSMTGFPFSASGAGDWTISKVANADRTVRVSGSGNVDGWGIGNAPVAASIQLAPTSSSRWDLIVWEIDWDADSWTLQAIKGGDGSTTQPMPNDTGTAGTEKAHIPIGWVRVASNQQLPTDVQQCRVWRNPMLYAESLAAVKPYQRPGLTVSLPDGSSWRSDGSNFSQLRASAGYWVGKSTTWSSGQSLAPKTWLVPVWSGSGTAAVSGGGSPTLPAGVWSVSLQLDITPAQDTVRLIMYLNPGSIPRSITTTKPNGDEFDPINGSSGLLTLTKPTQVAFALYNAGSTAVKLWQGGQGLTLTQIAQI